MFFHERAALTGSEQAVSQTLDSETPRSTMSQERRDQVVSAATLSI
jgi:hypothetical protein